MSKEKEFIDFVFGLDKEEITYFTHRTNNEETARKILKTGLYFSESFQKTTDLLLNDDVHIRYWKNLRKEYGAFTVIIGFSNQLLQNYQKLLNRLTKKNYEVQQVMTLSPPVDLDDADEVYTLPLQYVKGYVNDHTGEIVRNPSYDPHFDSPVFKHNVDSLVVKGK